MAKKTMKRPAAKKTAPAKKHTATRRMAAAPAVETVVVASPCGCKRGGFWRFFGKLLLILIIFGLGFFAGKICAMKHMAHMKAHQIHFNDNGCLDISKIKCPKMAEKVVAADVDGNGCITKVELKEFKKAHGEECHFRK